MNNMEINNLMNANVSLIEQCGWYDAVEAELIPAKEGSNKNDAIRFSLKKRGRAGRLGFSHYFTYAIPEDVAKYKALGVTEDGMSDEDYEKAVDRWDNAYDNRGRCKDAGAMPLEFFGTWWNIDFGTEMKNKNTGKVTSSTMVFVPCDEDNGMPLPDFVVNANRLANIMAGYEPVSDSGASSGDASGEAPVESPEEELARLRAEAASRK